MMRRSALATMKLDDGCTDCGFNEDPAALEWDHVRGKSWNIGSRRWCSIERLLEEVEKCEVVCANCHRIRTELRRAA